ncbi:hypothetical protein EVAR_95613_1 [Eumeta japonica]|uniref:Uncharacterized protein n=1 Tax=Eumeta variegata TaxID=151549 RepID=A0A4C1VK70_EUMVA|nr:hypothetical protein EVAR_95613_1 [Eumeta japonica]
MGPGSESKTGPGPKFKIGLESTTSVGTGSESKVQLGLESKTRLEIKLTWIDPKEVNYDGHSEIIEILLNAGFLAVMIAHARKSASP